MRRGRKRTGVVEGPPDCREARVHRLTPLVHSQGGLHRREDLMEGIGQAITIGPDQPLRRQHRPVERQLRHAQQRRGRALVCVRASVCERRRWREPGRRRTRRTRPFCLHRHWGRCLHLTCLAHRRSQLADITAGECLSHQCIQVRRQPHWCRRSRPGLRRGHHSAAVQAGGPVSGIGSRTGGTRNRVGHLRLPPLQMYPFFRTDPNRTPHRVPASHGD